MSKNKNGLWKLSPSGLYGFEECKACFWIAQHYEKAPGIPPVLNIAMDSVLKSRYDAFREERELPPEIAALGAEGVTLYPDGETLNKWRGGTAPLKVVNEETGNELGGKLDEVLVEKDGRLIPTDFKSSGYTPKPEKQKYYLLQLTAYAYMFAEHGLAPSDRGILPHYFVKDAKNPSLSVEFTSHIDPVPIDLANFPKRLKAMVALLNSPYPSDNPACEICTYFAKRREISQKP
jgi:PD-(D/E)XK nuclease superfamily